jgi:hypothetical protein
MTLTKFIALSKRVWNLFKDLTKTWDLKEGKTMAEADYEKLILNEKEVRYEVTC